MNKYFKWPFRTAFDKETARSFSLTVDVEPDAGPKWATTNPISFRGVLEALPKLEKFCQRWSVQATLFLNPVVLLDENCVRCLRDLSDETFELATHLHGDYLEPKARYRGPDFSGCDPVDMQCEYPESVEFGKLENLSRIFQQAFGYPARSFRAGRFGARSWTLSCLGQLGYTHDASVTPFRNWYDKADFSKAKHLVPYIAAENNLLEAALPGQSQSVIEVPVSITSDGAWLRPTPGFSEGGKIVDVARWFERQYDDVHLSAMLHNVELVTGMSPYTQTERETQAIWDTLHLLFDHLTSKGYTFTKIGDVEVSSAP